MSTISLIDQLGLSEQSKGLLKKDKETSDISIKEMIQEKLNNVNDLQKQADESTQQLITGEAENVHEVLLDTEEAVLALELTVKVNNKMVQAYQELMKMQI